MYKKNTPAQNASIAVAKIKIDNTNQQLVLSGEWNWAAINEKILQQLTGLTKQKWLVDGRQISALDTCGIYFLNKIVNFLQQQQKFKEILLIAEDQRIFELSHKFNSGDELNLELKQAHESIPERTGALIVHLWSTALELITFFGQLCYSLVTLFKRESSLYVAGIIETVASAGIRGVLISSLLCFLIGVNLTYQLAPQFVTYGANVFVVNFLGISLLREVTPLLTAIIVAGRSGSSITATIGTMKVQEEIDALQTMGISPMRRLVVPRVIGLVISLPILTMLADIASMYGGMLFADPLLGVDNQLFLSRLQSYVSVNNFWVGIVKSIFFAWIIGMVGCFCGFRVEGNADSVGKQTTRSVVISICLIIGVDALFAVLFKALGI